jgi:hypothetical protein
MEQPAAKSGMQFVNHLVYGLGTAAVFRLLSGDPRSAAEAANEFLRQGREAARERVDALS